jgi:hypothetical protein
MSHSARASAMSDDSARMGKLARPEGCETNMDHGQGEGSRGSALSGAVRTLNKQTARGSSAPIVGGRKMTDY